MIKQSLLKPVAASTLASLIVCVPVYADNQINEELITMPGRQISQQEEMTISASAVKALRHIAEARGALQGETPDIDKAKAQLGQSEKLLDIVQAALPTTIVKDRIWIAKKKLEYKDSEEVVPDLIPIYVSLDEMVDYVPAAQAKAHLDSAKTAMERGDKSSALKQLDAVDDALIYVEADLPLSSTRQLVGEAKQALAKRDTSAADKALAAAEENITFISLRFDDPLTQARAALYRGWRDIESGNKAVAKRDLSDAVGYLGRAAKSADSVTRDAVATLVSEVRDLHSEIDNSAADLGTRAESVWQRVKAMSERSAEYLSTGWQRLRHSDMARQQLIEAKLQLAYARIDQYKANDEPAAKIELAEAKSYLDTAAQQVNTATKKQVDELSYQVSQLEKKLNANQLTISDMPMFTRVESSLAGLIRTL